MAVIGRAALELSEPRRSPPTPEQPRAARPAAWKPGDTLPALDGIRFDEAERTLLLFVRSTCAFCTRSMPLYAKIAALAQVNSRDLRVVPISAEPVATTEKYFREHEVALSGALSLTPSSLRDLRLSGTPTMILVDSQGSVIQHWRGMVRPEDEKNVLTTLGDAQRVAAAEGR